MSSNLICDKSYVVNPGDQVTVSAGGRIFDVSGLSYDTGLEFLKDPAPAKIFKNDIDTLRRLNDQDDNGNYVISGRVLNSFKKRFMKAIGLADYLAPEKDNIHIGALHEREIDGVVYGVFDVTFDRKPELPGFSDTFEFPINEHPKDFINRFAAFLGEEKEGVEILKELLVRYATTPALITPDDGSAPNIFAVPYGTVTQGESRPLPANPALFAQFNRPVVTRTVEFHPTEETYDVGLITALPKGMVPCGFKNPRYAPSVDGTSMLLSQIDVECVPGNIGDLCFQWGKGAFPDMTLEQEKEMAAALEGNLQVAFRHDLEGNDAEVLYITPYTSIWAILSAD